MSKDPFESYKLYNAIKLHFESDSYDAIKYNYKTSVKASSFYKRRDKYFFAKVWSKCSSLNDMADFFVSNFVNDIKYVGEMLNEVGDSNYSRWKKYMQSLSYNFNEDINIVATHAEECGLKFDELFIPSENGQHPRIVSLYLKTHISLETLVILNAIFKFAQREDSKIVDTLIWPDLKRKLLKYEPFVKFDKNNMMKILKKRFTS